MIYYAIVDKDGLKIGWFETLKLAEEAFLMIEQEENTRFSGIVAIDLPIFKTYKDYFDWKKTYHGEVKIHSEVVK